MDRCDILIFNHSVLSPYIRWNFQVYTKFTHETYCMKRRIEARKLYDFRERIVFRWCGPIVRRRERLITGGFQAHVDVTNGALK